MLSGFVVVPTSEPSALIVPSTSQLPVPLSAPLWTSFLPAATIVLALLVRSAARRLRWVCELFVVH
jgi:hypothetical protein